MEKKWDEEGGMNERGRNVSPGHFLKARLGRERGVERLEKMG